MHTVDTFDPNCNKCKLTSEADPRQSSKEENRNILPNSTDVDEMQSYLYSARSEKAHWLETCQRLKEKIHSQVDELIGTLRQREMYLCAEVEHEYFQHMDRVDQDTMAQCLDHLKKRNREHKNPVRTSLVFNSPFDLYKSQLNTFGEISSVDVPFSIKKGHLKEHETSKRLEDSDRTVPETLPPPLSPISRAGQIDALAEKVESFSLASPLRDYISSSVEKAKDDAELCLASLKLTEKKCLETFKICANTLENIQKEDEDDDIEIISRVEIAGIQNELSPPLPPKSRFRFGRKSPLLSSLLQKKKDQKPLPASVNDEKYENPPCSNLECAEPLTTLKSVPMHEDTVVSAKDAPSSNEQVGQQSSRECLNGSSIEGQGQSSKDNPSAVLLSTFTKYLEKNPESEWLAPSTKRCEEWLSTGNSCVVSPLSNLKNVQNLDEWLFSRNSRSQMKEEALLRNWLASD